MPLQYLAMTLKIICKKKMKDHSNSDTDYTTFLPKPSLKIQTANTTYWNLIRQWMEKMELKIV